MWMPPWRRKFHMNMNMIFSNISMYYLIFSIFIHIINARLRPPIELSLPEDWRIGFLNPRIELNQDEKIKFAPIVKPYITIYANGTIYLHKPLNYEKDPKVVSTVMIENIKTHGLFLELS